MIKLPEFCECHRSAIEHLNGLDTDEVRDWLRRELFEASDTFSLQDCSSLLRLSLVFQYLPINLQQNTRKAVGFFILDWIMNPEPYYNKIRTQNSNDNVTIISEFGYIIPEIKPEGVKYLFQGLVLSKWLYFERDIYVLLGTISKFSTIEDLDFWKRVHTLYPKYENYSNQVMSRIESQN